MCVVLTSAPIRGQPATLNNTLMGLMRNLPLEPLPYRLTLDNCTALTMYYPSYNKSDEATAFIRDGAERFSSVLNDNELDQIKVAVSHIPPNRAGIRLKGIPALNAHLLPEGKLSKLVQTILGIKAKPVRAVLFDKTPITNWKLKWHQDRTIVVQQRIETTGYGPWSVKAGLQHVAPPFDLLAKMVTARVHLDKVDVNNAPLLIAPGSHRLGPVHVSEINSAVEKCGIFSCLAEAGDIWLYATPIIHASEAALVPTRRRVLQIDYSADELPSHLHWLGVL